MQIALTITASASVIAQILNNLPNDPGVIVNTEVPAAPLPVPGPAVGLAMAPVGSPVMPTLAPAAAPTPGEDDDNGPAAEGTPDVDSNGLPWDERIHSGGANRLNSDGTWRKRRGVAEATVATVEAELRAHGAAPQPAPIAVPQQAIPIPVAVPMQPTVPLAAAPVPTPAPAPMAIPAPIPAPTAAPTAEQLQEQVNTVTAAAPPVGSHVPGSIPTLPDLMAKMTPLFEMRDEAGAPLVHADYLAAVTTEVSNAFTQAGIIQQPLNAFTDIANPQMIDYAVQIMIRDEKWKV